MTTLKTAVSRLLRFESPKPEFFSGFFFRNCISCVFRCDDLLYIHFFILQFQYMIFIYSLVHKISDQCLPVNTVSVEGV